MLKYAARHWAHFGCWLNCKGSEIREPWIYGGLLSMLTAGLHDWQLQQFPVFKLSEWLQSHGVNFPKQAGKSWVDKARWLLRRATELSRGQETPS
jgi:hypothetical protein